jgi:hypothetical protein
MLFQRFDVEKGEKSTEASSSESTDIILSLPYIFALN